MLAWEQAPVLPIFKWFDPELRLPRPEVLTDEDLHQILCDVIDKLFEQRIVLDFTDHLSDRELYCLIFRDILPAREKKLEGAQQLPALGLHGPVRRSGGLADLLCLGRRAPGLGRDLRSTAPAPPPARLSPPPAPRALTCRVGRAQRGPPVSPGWHAVTMRSIGSACSLSNRRSIDRAIVSWDERHMPTRGSPRDGMPPTARNPLSHHCEVDLDGHVQ